MGLASLSVSSKPKMFSDKMTAWWQKADDISFHRFFSVSFIRTNIKQDFKTLYSYCWNMKIRYRISKKQAHIGYLYILTKKCQCYKNINFTLNILSIKRWYCTIIGFTLTISNEIPILVLLALHSLNILYQYWQNVNNSYRGSISCQ